MDRGRDRSLGCAVVGMAGTFPCAPDLDEFWSNLISGRDCIKRASRQELLQAGVKPESVSDPRFVAACGALEGTDKFDIELFGLPLGEARSIHAQHRVFLECVWQALESAGYFGNPRTKSVGVFGACSPQRSSVGALDPSDAVAADLGALADYVATRVSYLLDLRGPSLTVSTACSSSLMAVHLAMCSLLTGECDLALAGGSAIRYPLLRGHIFEPGGIYSADGSCRPYDAEASGTVSGDGAGIVVLKRLTDALRDGDPIHCVILGSAVNNDGREKVGYTAPSPSGQARVIRSALRMAGVAPREVGYIEGHGTGTRLGDPIEFAAFNEVWRSDTSVKEQRCVIGSVKSNIGHLDAASGIAGLIKAALSVKHAIIPGTLHFQRANPEIQLAGTPFCFGADSYSWEGPRLACVHNLGLGGTNVHMVIQQPPDTVINHSHLTHILPVSARSEPAARTYVQAVAKQLVENPASREGVAAALQRGRTNFGVRAAIVASPKSQVILPQVRVLDSPRLVFVCPGAGAQHSRMAEGLAAVPSVASWLSRADTRMKQSLGIGFWEAIRSERLHEAPVSFAATVSVSAAVAFGLAEFGLRPDAVVGLSLGELTAAAISGCFDFETLIELAVRRGNLFQQITPGACAIVGANFEIVQHLIRCNKRVGVAVVNSPDSCVISGPLEPLKEAVANLSEKGFDANLLPIPGAAHSPFIDSVRSSFENALEAAQPGVGTVPGFSSLDGEPFGSRLAVPQHWGRQLRETNRFDLCLRQFCSRDILLDLGPGRTLTSMLRSTSARVVNAMRHPEDETSDEDCFAVAIAQLWQHGANISWKAQSTTAALVPAPIAPLERTELGGFAPRGQQTATSAELEIWNMHWKPRPPANWVGPRVMAFIASNAETIAPFEETIRKQFVNLSIGSIEKADIVIDLHALEEHPMGALSSLAGTLPNVAVVTRNGADVLGSEGPEPLQAALRTFALVAGQENNSIKRSVVDVAGSFDVAAVLREILQDEGPRFRALRNGRVWVPTVTRMPQNLRVQFEAGGVYVLIGGLGRFGRWLARCSSHSQPRCIAFIQRSAVDGNSGDRAAGLIRELRAAGIDIRLFMGDASSPGFLSQTINELGRAFGRIDGILHLAADFNSAAAFSPLSDVAPDALVGYLQNQLKPKLDIALALRDALGTHTPGFVALFSSNASILGGPGLAFYAAANTALDALAQSQRARGLPWTSICWDGWRIPGELSQQTSLERFALSGQEALDLFERTLGADWGCVSAVKGDFSERWGKWFERLGYDPGESVAQPGETAKPQRPQRLGWSAVEERVADVWGSILGAATTDRHLDLFHLGGHSLMLLRMRTRLNAEFGVELPLADLLRHRTIAGTAALISVAQQQSEALTEFDLSAQQPDALTLLGEIESAGG